MTTDLIITSYQVTLNGDVFTSTLSSREKENTGEIVFLGGNYAMSNMNYPSAQERIELVEFLQKEFPDKFRVYGMGWEGTKMVHAQDEIKIYNQAKIAITHNNFQRKGYTSDRLFRAIGCGAMTISHTIKTTQIG